MGGTGCEGKLGLSLVGRVVLSESLIQFSADGFIKMQRLYQQGPYSQSYGFSSSLESMLELDHKEG